ncbi:hypothetical protein [Stenotrophomonas sp. ZAC14A_NAIMI4_1]|uniref:hypothetical protein n=1 Tax=Stenotrophomonas sp. ZAC14A_NAIMI4_1 TaxID=2072412 RepID=UPI000D53C9A2|nr:hypothetical protein [Stenotrophomonas sp. ZAC14A_NAIMI4_1]AWH45374.1 hypothetical protein C1926_10195 [Stenotrophomonas sp. ZAC14A_NAIMI4_1]
MNSTLDRFRSAILNAAPSDGIAPDLLISRSGQLETYYAPFEHVNTDARVVLVGITPGLFQAQKALEQLRIGLRSGLSDAEALRTAKEVASFSGPMRTALVQMLDCVGLHAALGLGSCAELFTGASDQVHYTSALRNPVLASGQNYTGNPAILRTPYLRSMAEEWLGDEARQLPDALWVPLGKEPTAVLRSFVAQGLIQSDCLLDGLPHPSGANAERIAYFLGRKQREHLSAKTKADTIDAARDELMRKVGRCEAR